MVQVYNVHLNHKKQSESTALTIGFNIRFSEYELKYKFFYSVKIEIKGRDYESLEKDNLLQKFDDVIELSDSIFKQLKDDILIKEYTLTIPNKTLDEDIGGDEDEIYAKVTVSPLIPCGDTAISNIIKDHFE